ncbi:MAG TPA: amidohydrolase family protein [Actinomycetes bacterium]
MTGTPRLGVAAAVVDGELVSGDVRLDGDVVAAVGLPPAPGGGIAVPGLVDVQVNGYAGIDLLTAPADDWQVAARAMARHGVTSFVANLITAPAEQTTSALRAATEAVSSPGDGAARCLGAHLEGPFLAAGRRGTHPLQHLRDPDRAALQPLLDAGPVVSITIAPELPGAVEVITWLCAAGVLVALGHSDATADEAHAGFDAGARTVTHVFNGMSAPTARAPGLAGVALARDDVVVQAILDGVHLAPETAAVVVSAARSRLVLVTDALSAAGAPDGDYRLGDVAISMVGGVARNADGALAGSVTSLVATLRLAMTAGLRLEEAAVAASTRPAVLLGRTDLGRLRPGDRADVTVLDDALDVTACFVGGVGAR